MENIQFAAHGTAFLGPPPGTAGVLAGFFHFLISMKRAPETANATYYLHLSRGAATRLMARDEGCHQPRWIEKSVTGNKIGRNFLQYG